MENSCKEDNFLMPYQDITGTYKLRNILKKSENLLHFAERYMPPVLDRSIDPSFDFIRCYGYEDEWRAHPPSLVSAARHERLGD
jgi:hypothetical protein